MAKRSLPKKKEHIEKIEKEVDEESGSEGQPEEEEERVQQQDEAVEEHEQEQEENIALDDADEVDEDLIPERKLVINNIVALDRIRDTIKLDPSLPWTETLSVTYPEKIDVDVNDDLNRELAFYKQALHGAQLARKLADEHKLPFTRPADFFAEMVKSDAHMERIRQRLLDESASIKKSEGRRKEREGKKYGKQVQIEKMKERERSKKAMEERLKGLKRKSNDVLRDTEGDEAFDVAVEDAIFDRRTAKRTKVDNTGTTRSKMKPKMPRDRRDAKFGFGGGKGRRSKQNTRESTEQFDFGAGRNGKGGKKGARPKPMRPGKSRRLATRRR